ncbi:MAG: type II secretion system protein [Campylobacterota bacterium]|nr:type II secretion system protein [Campylobacterota bacterium]
MDKNRRSAFTMLELVFVIVVIGILSAIAIPKFAVTRDDAIMTKARTTLASVRSSLATERQKRILRGNFDNITRTDIGYDTTNSQVFGELLEYPVKICSGSGATSCWAVTGSDAAPVYTFRKPSGGSAVFTLTGNRLTGDF